MATALLVLSLAALIWFQRKDVRVFDAFVAIEDTRHRQRIFLKWAAKSCAFNLGVPLAGLALLGRLDALWEFPPEFYALAAPLPSADLSMFLPLLVGMGIGLALVTLRFMIRRRRGAGPTKAFKVEPLYARSPAEMLHQIPLILNAGVSEEVFNRLYLPLLMTLAGLDPLLAFIATTLIFGLLHRYQGLLGVVLSAVIGGVLALAYLCGEGLWLPIVLHLVLNTNALLLRPAIKRHFAAPPD